MPLVAMATQIGCMWQWERLAPISGVTFIQVKESGGYLALWEGYYGAIRLSVALDLMLFVFFFSICFPSIVFLHRLFTEPSCF